MKKCLFGLILFGFATNLYAQQKTAFQTASPWKPPIDVRSDMAIVYGVDDKPGLTFEQRVQSWRDHGYTAAFMTGIAWAGVLGPGRI